MLRHINNLYLEKIVNFLFYFFPISFILGSLILNLNLFLLIIVSLLFIYKSKYYFKLNYSNVFLTLFFTFIIFTSFINIESNNYDNAIKSIFLLRFLILYFIIELLLINNKLDLKNFFIISLTFTVFVSLDVIFQYIFGYDIFGYLPWDGMIAGPFEHEAIAGSFIQRFALFSIFASIFLFNKKNINNKILFFVILLLLVGTFLASNRMSLVLLIGSLFIIFFIYKKIRTVLFLSLLSFITIAAILINNDATLKKKYQHMYKRFFVKQVEQKEDNLVSESKSSSNKKVNLYSSYHFRIYTTVIKSWQNKPLLGQGHKSFRTKCRNIVEKNENLSCSTHAHNYHLQILHDFGIIGILLISTFVFMFLFKVIKKFKQYKFWKENYFLYIIPIITTIIIEIWPVKSSGDILTTWNGTLVWLIVALGTITNTNYNDKNLNPPIKSTKNLIITFASMGLIFLIIKRIYLEGIFYSTWDRVF